MNNPQSYAGTGQTFTPSLTSVKYKMECWGAAGGTDQSKGTAGRGAYTSGEITLTKDEVFYIFVGGRGVAYASSTSTGGGGWNGGGWGSPTTEPGGYNNFGGGGATDIRLSGNTNSTWNNATHLRSRIMVAAGGGGLENYSGYSTVGGYAGGLTGGRGTTTNAQYSDYNTFKNTGATQTGTGNYYTANGGSFGYANTETNSSWGGGGGSGFWGGIRGYGQGGSGGSSYISGHAGCVAITSASSTSASTAGSANSIERSKHYSGKYFTNTVMVDGEGYKWTTSRSSTRNVMPQTSGSGTENGHYDNGHARITCLPYD